MKIIFRNVKVVNADGHEVRDVFVEDGKIVASFEVFDEEIDGTGKYLMPGVIDVHVHFRSPGAEHKETWETGSRAAAMGGVTTVLDMPNNSPACTTLEALAEKRELVKGKSFVNYGFHFGATSNFNALKEVRGVPAFKLYMGNSTGDLLEKDESSLEKVFKIAKERGLPVIVHAEAEDRIRERMRLYKGHDEAVAHAHIRDDQCAIIATGNAIAMREKIGNKMHLAHMSTAEELDYIRSYKHNDLSCEVTPHHLYFSMDDMDDSFLKMNPPLRAENGLVRLWEGVRDGSVNCIATDHAPHTIEEKSRSHWDAPSGVPGVQFVLPLMLNEVNEKMIDFDWLVRLLCTEPARIFSIKNKGAVRESMDADLVLVDMDIEKTITKEMVESKCGWTPYEGYKLKGWPVMTVVNGEIVMRDGEIVGERVGCEIEV